MIRKLWTSLALLVTVAATDEISAPPQPISSAYNGNQLGQHAPDSQPRAPQPGSQTNPQPAANLCDRDAKYPECAPIYECDYRYIDRKQTCGIPPNSTKRCCKRAFKRQGGAKPQPNPSGSSSSQQPQQQQQQQPGQQKPPSRGPKLPASVAQAIGSGR